MAVYLIHFFGPVRNRCHHYIGCTKEISVMKRVVAHKRGKGAKIVRDANKAGVYWRVVKVWPLMSWGFERWLKRQKGAKRFCPVCRGRG